MTPFEKTEKDIRHLGDMIEKQLHLVTDPKVSEFRAVFQGLTLAIRSAKLQVKICRALGISEEVHPHSLEDFHLLIGTTEAKGSCAADKIKSMLPDIQKMIDAVDTVGAKGQPFRVVRACRKAFNP